MRRAVDGHGFFTTPDGLDIRVVLGIVMGGDGPPRVEISSIHDPSDLVSIEAVDRAAKVLLLDVSQQLRRRAYRSRPFDPDPKPKDYAKIRSAVRDAQAASTKGPRGNRRPRRKA